jgi:exosome complex exonuclease DIS3/RRP44
VREYISTLDNHQNLLDKLSHKSYDTDAQGKNREPLFPAHLSAEQVHLGIKSGKLFQGVFYASRDNFLEGTVSVDGQEKPVRIIFLIIYSFSLMLVLF